MERQMRDYLPPVLREVRDFACLTEQYQDSFEELWRAEAETEANFYLETAGERGLSHWEHILDLTPGAENTLEERRQVLRARLGQTTPYCWATLLNFLTALTGSEEAYAAELTGFKLTVWLRPLWRGLEAAVWELVRYMVPANVEIHLSLIFRTHGALAAMTHGELGDHTHEQLRSEVNLV